MNDSPDRLVYSNVQAATAIRPTLDIDARIIARAKRGDQQAFAAVVRHYDRGLRVLAYRLLGDRDRMDDVLQDAYVKAFRALPNFRGEARLGTWLYRITYNACLDDLRRSQNVVPLRFDDEIDRAAPVPDPLESVGERTALASALAALPPDERAAVLLVDADGFDYAAAGEVLGVPAGTVASRLNRARAALRRSLRDVPEGADER